MPLLTVALVASLVGNVQDFSTERPYSGRFLRNYRNLLLAMPRAPFVDQVPRDVHPERSLAPWVSLGWLVDGVESGRIPPPGEMDAHQRAAYELRVALQEHPDHRPVDCEAVLGPVDARLERGSSIRMPGAGQLWVEYFDSTGAVGRVPFRGSNLPVIAYATPLEVRVSSTAPDRLVELCDLDGGPVTVRPGP
jgi:hypothetical protein